MRHDPAMHMAAKSKNVVSHEVTFKTKQQIAEGTYAFTFVKPAGFDFRAGQHVRMTLIDPPETDAEGDSRFLTMASTPQEPDLVFAMRMRDTAFKRVMGRMQSGGRVLIQMLLESPHGSFVLHEDASRLAVFIAGGIGIVPAYSMIKDAIQRRLPHEMILFYANRRPEDAPFLAELEYLAKQHGSFRLIATITEPERLSQAWSGETGFINRAMLEKYVHALKSPIYYVAGLPDMVAAMQTVLAEIGISKDNIRAEEFAGFETGHTDRSPKSVQRTRLQVAGIVLAVILLVTLHVGGGASLYRIWRATSAAGLAASVLIVLLLSVLTLKIAIMRRAKHSLHAGHRKGKEGGPAHAPDPRSQRRR
jgi:ferredoxin-NADP reductase